MPHMRLAAALQVAFVPLLHPVAGETLDAGLLLQKAVLASRIEGQCKHHAMGCGHLSLVGEQLLAQPVLLRSRLCPGCLGGCQARPELVNGIPLSLAPCMVLRPCMGLDSTWLSIQCIIMATHIACGRQVRPGELKCTTTDEDFAHLIASLLHPHLFFAVGCLLAQAAVQAGDLPPGLLQLLAQQGMRRGIRPLSLSRLQLTPLRLHLFATSKQLRQQTARTVPWHQHAAECRSVLWSTLAFVLMPYRCAQVLALQRQVSTLPPSGLGCAARLSQRRLSIRHLPRQLPFLPAHGNRRLYAQAQAITCLPAYPSICGSSTEVSAGRPA